MGSTALATERTDRRLAAILAADVAGYSRLMGADEEGTLERLKALRRELIDPRIAGHRGRIVKTTGDGAPHLCQMFPHTGTWTLNEFVLVGGDATSDNLPPRFGAVDHQDARRADQPRDGGSGIPQHAARRHAAFHR